MAADLQRPEAFPPPALVFTLTLVEVTSFVVVTIRRRQRLASADIAELHAFARRIRAHNLALGWWGLFGLVWTPWALLSNRKASAALDGLAAGGRAAPGWYRDPSGRHVNRYWDGATWTDQVSDPTVQTDPTVPSDPAPAS
ncbi:MAG TPA: DUF2510 domain-containing protein [Acidimicrobiales bacterium]|nr:DUF2510 domain-containing protein [Acidimicrobiales bacterium]